MEAIEILQIIFFVLLSLVSLLFIIFLTLGIFLMMRIKRYLAELAQGIAKTSSDIHDQLGGVLSAFIKLPLIGFIVKRLFKKFFK